MSSIVLCPSPDIDSERTHVLRPGGIVFVRNGVVEPGRSTVTVAIMHHAEIR
jgi:hypothetical protein